MLNDGSRLTVKRSLTLGSGVTIVLNGGDYTGGDTIMVVEGDLNQTEGTVTLDYGYGRYVLEGTEVKLVGIFNQNYADTLTVSNWGIATASRAFVNTIRGQCTNTGCIANGKGTAWAAVLGGNRDINGSDINLKGAAVGADVKLGAAG